MAGLGVLKGAHVLVCGMECVDLETDMVKILGPTFLMIKILRKCDNNGNYRKRIIKIKKP